MFSKSIKFMSHPHQHNHHKVLIKRRHHKNILKNANFIQQTNDLKLIRHVHTQFLKQNIK